MRLDKIGAKNNKDEYYTPKYAIEPILKYLKPNSTIWCPFDTCESWFVKTLQEQGHKIIYTHINNGFDFFRIPIEKIKEMDIDYIISNPPFSCKTKVIKRLFEIGKPFAMLVGINGVFESQERFNMFKNNKFEIMYLNKRVAYFTDYIEQIPMKSPPFSSMYVCSKILPKQIVFEEIKNRKKECINE